MNSKQKQLADQLQGKVQKMSQDKDKLLKKIDTLKSKIQQDTSIIEKSHRDPVYDIAWLQGKTAFECASTFACHSANSSLFMSFTAASSFTYGFDWSPAFAYWLFQ